MSHIRQSEYWLHSSHIVSSVVPLYSAVVGVVKFSNTLKAQLVYQCRWHTCMWTQNIARTVYTWHAISIATILFNDVTMVTVCTPIYILTMLYTSTCLQQLQSIVLWTTVPDQLQMGLGNLKVEMSRSPVQSWPLYCMKCQHLDIIYSDMHKKWNIR